MRSDGHEQFTSQSFRRYNRSNRLIKWVWLVAGTIFVGLGVLGILLPILPTTPFLLLAAACYARSSDKFYNWLLNNKWFGKYIIDYREKGGILLKIKIISIALLWITILISAVFFTGILFIRMILILIAIGVSVILLLIRTIK